MAPSAAAPTFAEQLAVEPGPDPDTFISTALPGKMGNNVPIAYGGCTLGVAVHAACLTTAAPHTLYSVVGHYLGPASTTQKLHLRVTRVRSTRSFATRRVDVLQPRPSSLPSAAAPELSLVLSLTADFIARSPALLTFSTPPSPLYAGSSPADARPADAIEADLIQRGLYTEQQAAVRKSQFELGARFFESRLHPAGVFAQRMMGLARGVGSSQDGDPLWARTSAEWLRVRAGQMPGLADGDEAENRALQAAALAFALDGALPFMPLVHSGAWLDEAGACSSLDFALRVFAAEVDVREWGLKELKSAVAREGLTYSETRLWDGQGRMVASMTQHSILRPKEEREKAGKL